MLVHLPSAAGGITAAALQLIVAASSYGAQTSPQTATPYSKFFKNDDGGTSQTTLPSRHGMLIIYTPSVVVGGAAVASAAAEGALGTRGALVSVLVLVHFLKRCMEVAFLHKYSGKMGMETAGFIGF